MTLPDGSSDESEAQSGTTRAASLQSWIARPVYREAVGVVTGMQDDVDPSYSMRRLLEDAIGSYCEVLEQQHNGGARWTAARRLNRRGIDPQMRTAGNVALLQSWVSPAVRGRLYGTVNAMKRMFSSYTMRDHLEATLSREMTRLKGVYGGAGWVPLDELRRGRRRGALPLE